ncbi:MAG: hypothetical protein FK733_17335 [Asgard group archaeon]|nr:hypothetical protein [Asgard group archaeon]
MMDNKSIKIDVTEIPPKLSNYDAEIVTKALDPDYSLFDEVVEILPKFHLGGLVIVSGFALLGLAAIIIWLILTIKDGFDSISSAAFLGLGIPLILLVPFFFFFSNLNATRVQKEIRQLLSEGDLESLHIIYPGNDPNLYGATYKTVLVFFALLSLKDEEAIQQLPTFGRFWSWLKFNKILLLTKQILAIKLDFPSAEDFIKDIKERISQENQEELIVIPISKAYKISSLPDGTRCMISKTQIDSTADLLVCPYCISFAKSNLLEEWLKYKNRCPSCNRFLKIEDCAVVVIKSDN